MSTFMVHSNIKFFFTEWKAAHEFVPASKGVNIGLPFVSSTNSKTTLSKLQQWTKKRAGRQTAARHKECQSFMIIR